MNHWILCSLDLGGTVYNAALNSFAFLKSDKPQYSPPSSPGVPWQPWPFLFFVVVLEILPVQIPRPTLLPILFPSRVISDPPPLLAYLFSSICFARYSPLSLPRQGARNFVYRSTSFTAFAHYEITTNTPPRYSGLTKGLFFCVIVVTSTPYFVAILAF